MNSQSLADETRIIAQTRQWLERAVIGLNLCPFAKAPYACGQLRIQVSAARNTDDLLDALQAELLLLRDTPSDEVETTLLVHPGVLADFLDYNDFLDAADAELVANGLEGEIQIASFHPEYCFADSEPEDVSNFTNRSPYPMLHLLREPSVERAVGSLDDPDAVYLRNIEVLRGLGDTGWRALWDEG
ncbi:DUF1415 domain-containing protein [Algiphilus sp. W345]|uniref:DUF1415 domain-containing protein n=1 Tax=Banduia mediterranea TaxID=3075609 RepID=A0ABU2WLP8_9GAMM|nr:DUF1415 domain-containing protein [Algiphilus sp. W345]MDT0498478.1 DUF1415 domain-containing protein [Algiphilus sp. W345]